MLVRPATAADFLAFHGELPPYRVKAFAGIVDGEVVGLAGLAFPHGSPMPIAWADMSDDARRHAVALHKAAKAFFAGYRGRVACAADPAIPASRRWLERLGFVPTGTMSPDGEVYVWQN
jgi:hypothetical protein